MECATEDNIVNCATDQYSEMGGIVIEYLRLRGNIHCVFGQIVDYLNRHSNQGYLRKDFNVDEIRQGIAEAQTRRVKRNFELDDEVKCYDESAPIKP